MTTMLSMLRSDAIPSPQHLAALRSRLLSRIHRKYVTTIQTHAVGPLRLAFTRVANPDVVLDRIVAEEDRREKVTGERRDGNDLHLPYWAELWDSAMGIGEVLLEAGNTTFHAFPSSSAPHVLDLGCGMGFAGMVAAAMGAQVLFADLEPDALLFARLNSLAWKDRVRTRRLNWQTDQLDERFDCIIGADVLYDKTQWEFLDRFFRAHLNGSGQILLGEPGRQTGDMFPDWIVQRGWRIQHLQQRVASRPAPIRIFKLTREER